MPGHAISRRPPPADRSPLSTLVIALLRCRTGSSAVEFALLGPVLVFLVFVVYDGAQALIAWRRVSTAAQEIALIATELSVQADGSTSLTPQQLYQAATAIFAVFPGLKTGADTSAFSVTVSAIMFTGSPAGCIAGMNCSSYAANTAWSYALPQGQAVTRPCGGVTQVPPSQTASLTTIPTAGISSLTSVLVTDVSYVFTPFSTLLFGAGFTMQRSAYLPPRVSGVSPYIEYDVVLSNGSIAANPSDGAICPGYL